MRKILLPSLLFFILSFSFLFISAHQAIAQSCDEDPKGIKCTAEALQAAKEDNNLQGVTVIQSNVQTWNAVCQLASPEECKAAGYTYEGSAIGMLDRNILAMYQNPVANPDMFIADIGNNMGIISPAYAQQANGIGFSGLSPLLGIWKGFRNVAYAFLILIMVVIGFMIMLRHRLDPRTVITIQNALPGVVISLILVTFSYAIAGLLIDLMYLIIGIFYVVINGTGGNGIADLKVVSQTSFPGVFSTMMDIGLESLGDVIGILWGAAKSTTGAIGGGTTGAVGIAALYFSELNPFVIGGEILIAALPILIVMLGVLFAMLRVWFMLLSAYIQVLISVLFAPLQIMLGAIPGNSGFGSWARGLAANLSVFAVTAILLELGVLISFMLNKATNLWTPPGVSGAAGGNLAGLIGLGIALVIPSIAGAVKESFQAKPIAPVGASTFLSPIASLTGGIQQGIGLMGSLRLLSRP